MQEQRKPDGGAREENREYPYLEQHTGWGKKRRSKVVERVIQEEPPDRGGGVWCSGQVL